jgi:molybdopterin-guanine dinucleotide biosynthesis protein A
VLAGGRGSRLGGVEKGDLVWRGRTLIEHVVDSFDVPVVVVGPERAVDARFVLEEPRFGGPVAGLRAAIDLIETPLVALLAVDMPQAVQVLNSLVDQWNGEFEAMVATREGQDEYMCSVFDAAALRRSLADCGDSMRSLFDHLDVTRVEIVAAQAELLNDIDTAEDLELLERDPAD